MLIMLTGVESGNKDDGYDYDNGEMLFVINIMLYDFFSLVFLPVFLYTAG